MKPLEISASIVVYKNEPEEVVSAIESVLSSPMRTACTVVDNSPTQDLRDSIRDAGANYIFAGKNLGFGAGHNLAYLARDSAADYHLALNPDVRFRPQILESLHRFMDDNPCVGLVMPKILNADGTEQRLCKQLPSPLDLLSRRFLTRFSNRLMAAQAARYELQDLNLAITREIPCLSGCFMFLRSKVLGEVGFFDERYFMYMEDVDLCRRIGAKYQTVFYPSVAITHGYSKGSYSSGTLLKYHMRSAIRYFGKWGWLWDPERQRLNKKTDPIESSLVSERSQEVSSVEASVR